MTGKIAVVTVLIGVGWMAAVVVHPQEQKKEEKAVTLKSVLLEQLRSTHDNREVGGASRPDYGVGATVFAVWRVSAAARPVRTRLARR